MALALALLFLSRPAALPSTIGSLWGGAVLIVVDFALPILGGLIASRRPDNPIGWVLCAGALANATDYFAKYYAVYALLDEPNFLPGGLVAAWVSNWVAMLAIGLLPLFFLLFPTGRLPSHCWQPVAVFAVLLYAALPVGYALLPGPLRIFPSLENPLGREGVAGEIVPGIDQGLAFMVLLLTTLISLVSLVLRFRRSRREERQQIKWVAYAGALIVAYRLVDSFFQEVFNPVSPILDAIFFGLLWAAIGIAILRYRLYEIDLIINHTLVYSLLTVTLALTYFGSVFILNQLFVAFVGEGPQLVVIASTLVIVALFNPLRRRIQDFIDRRFYRRKYDAAKMLEAFGSKLREQTDVDKLYEDLVSVMRETVQPEHVSLWLRPPKAKR